MGKGRSTIVNQLNRTNLNLDLLQGVLAVEDGDHVPVGVEVVVHDLGLDGLALALDAHVGVGLWGIKQASIKLKFAS